MDNSFVSLGYTYSSLSSLFSSEQEAKAVGPTGLEFSLLVPLAKCLADMIHHGFKEISVHPSREGTAEQGQLSSSPGSGTGSRESRQEPGTG